jgi:hypothetical protein
MHDVDFHHGMTVASSPSHGAHMFAINEDGDAERFDDLLDEYCNEVRGAFLILKATGKVSGNARELGKAEDFFVGNVSNRNLRQNWEEMMFAKADFLDSFDNDHVVTNSRLAFGLEHFRELVGFGPGTLGHFKQGFGGAHWRLFGAFGLKVHTELLQDAGVVPRDCVNV